MTAAPQKVYFVSLGCPKNQVDTEVMLGQVRGAGHVLVEDAEGADVIVVNTCAFIDAAKERLLVVMGELRAEVASEITRRRVPELSFHIAPAAVKPTA